eukprot:15048891-Alexandrium_andersonii.AAC.1
MKGASCSKRSAVHTRYARAPMDRGRTFSTGVGRALASSACFGRKAVRQECMACGQRPVRSAAAKMPASA